VITAVSKSGPSAWAGRAGRVAGVAALAVVATAALAPAQAQRVQPGVNAPLTFADIVERVKPSVVSISVSSGGRAARTTRRRRGGRNGLPFPDLPNDHPLNEFFKNLPGGNRNAVPSPRRRMPRRAAQGSGFVISKDGFVVTNNHVVSKAEEISVSFGPKEGTYEAELIGKDPRTDLALLKIKSDKEFTPVRFADDVGRVGDWVVAVGNPFGLGGTVTVGVLSALSRDIGSSPYDFIQIDAAVNRGNSGGPTFNLEGEVIGVNTAIYSPSGGNVGIAFAVPAVTAVKVIEQLKTYGEVRRGWLGVRIQNVDEDIAASLGLDDARGALVNEVTDGAPADEAGLRSGDVILRVNETNISDSRDLARKIAEFSPETTVQVEIRRGARDLTVPVKLGRFPTNLAAAGRSAPEEEVEPETSSVEDLGLSLSTLEEPRGKIETGVIITDVAPDSNAAEKGLSEGDIIVQVNSQPVATPSDVEQAVRKAKRLGRPAVLLTVETSNGSRFVAVQFKKDD